MISHKGSSISKSNGVRDWSTTPSQELALLSLAETGVKIKRRTIDANGILKVSCQQGKLRFDEMIGRGGRSQTILKSRNDLTDVAVVASLLSEVAGGVSA